MANYLKITKLDTVNGPGCRVTLWVSGCRNHCPGCQNPESWDFAKGTEITSATADEILSLLAHEYIAGLTICGGEPMEPENQEALVDLVAEIKSKYPDKSIWCFTGYELSDLLDGGRKHAECTDALLKNIDVLIVGRFILGQKDITRNNLWRGSRNQRVLDVKKSLAVSKPVALDGIPNNEI